jgi:hypothetical protein
VVFRRGVVVDDVVLSMIQTSTPEHLAMLLKVCAPGMVLTRAAIDAPWQRGQNGCRRKIVPRVVRFQFPEMRALDGSDPVCDVRHN